MQFLPDKASLLQQTLQRTHGLVPLLNSPAFPRSCSSVVPHKLVTLDALVETSAAVSLPAAQQPRHLPTPAFQKSFISRRNNKNDAARGASGGDVSAPRPHNCNLTTIWGLLVQLEDLLTIITAAFPRTHLNQWVDRFLSKSRDLTLSLLPDTLPNTYSPLSMSVARIFPNTYTFGVHGLGRKCGTGVRLGGSVSRDDKR